MTVECFFDTNVFLYAALGAKEAPEKKAAARDLIATRVFGVSTQVLQEFYHNAIKKSDRPLTPAVAMEWVQNLAAQPCITVDRDVINCAIETSQRYRISYWDAAILTAAEFLGAPIVFTEDLNHGQTYGAVKVVNPFRPV